MMDSWGWFLLGVGCGAGLLVLFILMGWNPGFLLGVWLMVLLSWAIGRTFSRQQR